MKAVITVVGKDTVGILAKVSTVCSEHEANVIEVSQSVLQDMFAMIMLVVWRLNQQQLYVVKKIILKYTLCTKIFLILCIRFKR